MSTEKQKRINREIKIFKDRIFDELTSLYFHLQGQKGVLAQDLPIPTDHMKKSLIKIRVHMNKLIDAIREDK